MSHNTEILEVVFRGRNLQSGDFVVDVAEVDKELDDSGKETGRDIGKPRHRIASSKEVLTTEEQSHLISFIQEMSAASIPNEKVEKLGSQIKTLYDFEALSDESVQSYNKINVALRDAASNNGKVLSQTDLTAIQKAYSIIREMPNLKDDFGGWIKVISQAQAYSAFCRKLTQFSEELSRLSASPVSDEGFPVLMDYINSLIERAM